MYQQSIFQEVSGKRRSRGDSRSSSYVEAPFTVGATRPREALVRPSVPVARLRALLEKGCRSTAKRRYRSRCEASSSQRKARSLSRVPEMVALGHARDRCGHDACLAAVASTCCVRHAELHTSANPTPSAMYWPVLRSSLRCPLGPED